MSDRLARQRDEDKEALDAWFQGTGSTVVLGFFAVASLAFAWMVAQDSVPLALLIVAVGPAIFYARKQDWL